MTIPSPLICGERGSVQRRIARGVLLMGALAAWSVLLVWGWRVLLNHTYQPAKTGRAVEQWPGRPLPGEAAPRFRIVVFAHPLCPCTRATLNKLDESLTRLPQDASIRLVFVSAGLAETDVAASSLIDFARQLPRVVVEIDPDGARAERFGATVSGEVFAFDGFGQRVFHGGITSGRGHEGESRSLGQLEQLAGGLARGPCTAPVYGCALPGRSSAPGIASTDAASNLPTTSNSTN